MNKKKAGMEMGFSAIFKGWHVCSFLLLPSIFYHTDTVLTKKEKKGLVALIISQKCSERSLCKGGLLWVSTELICRSMEARLRQQEF